PICIVIVGGFIANQGHITIGVIFSFCTYLQYLYDPIKNLTDLNMTIQQGKAVEHRLRELIPTNQEENAQGDGINHIEKITFKDVNFKYDERTLIKNLNLEIKKGNKVAITGPSGIGKSTLIKLLLRQEVPNGGAIMINDKDLNDVDIYSYRDHVAVMSQNTFIFDGTMEENISMGHQYNEKEMEEVINNCCLDGTGAENVKNYSGGEKQRIGIARMLIKDADVIILDEPTSALDSHVENEIIKNIDKIVSNDDKIIVIISHKESTLDLCDYKMSLNKDLTWSYSRMK
ncbi:ABC transporter ATP-binding protein/permease, partial [Lachnospiraceae bacterium OttesenSCG-928-D06]|nr:ABC transporter ATP-binding protein/permease [Lachnospiraceae bacterium OttesenSCG-928-D06]